MLEPILHTMHACVATWELSVWNVIFDPIMHGKCTMHGQKGVATLESSE